MFCRRIPTLWFAAGAVALLGCQESVVGPDGAGDVPAASRAPVQVPIGEQFVDLNPCTGEPTTYTFNGTARVQAFDDHYLLVASGTVKTDDGFAGTFNRQFIFQGDQVVHLRFHDSEITDGSGQRILFGVGLFHQTSPRGDPVVSFEQFSGLRCVGQTR